MATHLDNPPENPCFGCGPLHPRGLRLQFARVTLPDGREAIETRPTPKPDEIGWHGLLHTGLHFSTLFEASYWAAWEFTGQVHTAFGPQTFDQTRLPRVGTPFVARAWIAADASDGLPLRVRAESQTPEGKPLARLDAMWRPASRAVMEKAGLRLPDYLLRDMAP